jgi:hypothetical protein
LVTGDEQHDDGEFETNAWTEPTRPHVFHAVLTNKCLFMASSYPSFISTNTSSMDLIRSRMLIPPHLHNKKLITAVCCFTILFDLSLNFVF